MYGLLPRVDWRSNVMPAPSKKNPSEDEKEVQQIYQEIVDQLKPANAEEEKFCAEIAAPLLLDRKSKLESSSARGKKTRKTPSALKHGAYSNIAILDGEDPKKFEKLHRDLIAEFVPQGALEDHIIATMARLMWRKENLATNRRATLRLQQIRSPGEVLGSPLHHSSAWSGRRDFSCGRECNGVHANEIDGQFDEGPGCRRTIGRIA